MKRQSYSSSREAIIANALRQVVSELRLVDVSDYIAFIRLERFATVAEIVDSAAERYLLPGTLRLGPGGEAQVDWRGEPRIVLDLELRPRGATIYFRLGLAADHASVDVSYVTFDRPSDDPAQNTSFLAKALDEARIRRTAETSLSWI